MLSLFFNRRSQCKSALLSLTVALIAALAACGGTGGKSLVGSVGASSSNASSNVPAGSASSGSSSSAPSGSANSGSGASGTNGGSSSSGAASNVAPPTIPLSSVTTANTSAAANFGNQSNGNVGATSISKVPTGTLLPSGPHTPIYAHLLGWFGQASHMDVGYTSSDPAQIHRQVEDALSRGIAGFILDWYGPTADTLVNNTLLGLKTEAESQAGNFSFAVMYDGGALTNCHNSGCDLNQQAISDLTYSYMTAEQSSAYIRLGGRPVVLFFDVDRYGILDWGRIQASVPGNPVFLFNGSVATAFSHPAGGGAYSWVLIDSSNAADWQSAYLDSFYSTGQSASRFAMGATYKGFNDSLAAWGLHRTLDQDCGHTWLNTFGEASKFASAATAGVQIVTWNDYEEGTEIESGIDNCVAVSASASGHTLSWKIAGDESTIDHYTVFASSDGKNLTNLGDVPPGSHSFDLSAAPANASSVFVQAVGKPSLTNKMSAAVAYTPGS